MAKRAQSKSVRRMDRKGLKATKAGIQIQPYSQTFRGGVSVAAADTNGDSGEAAPKSLHPCL